DEKHLPHYTPPGPTIREFFATLGAYRPPENGGMASFTARAALPEIDATEKAEPADEFPLVSDALANLFPDSPVTEEDSRAAFALSGALSGQPSPQVTRARSTPPASVPAVTAPILDVPPAARESEEDIRKFREWLDGLADS
ncbi:MAG TPA: hypothetical protein VFC35_01385, partial [Gemmatimonadaceae bacterium]|nr:hypothetical protein [Gemmatimonadaceae bacterium]